jgi:zinc/manganese transport system ATP-binding protein
VTVVAATNTAATLHRATLRFGTRTLWQDLALAPGELLAVLGPNGAGKSSLLRVMLGQLRLAGGAVTVAGQPARRGNRAIGLIPQRGSGAATGDVRARDLVRFRLDGHRWGLRRDAGLRAGTDALLDSVGALALADVPVRLLSGGEQQRVRVAQALASDPSLLLCDEPLAALDLHHQHAVAHLIDGQRRARTTAVVFVTHDINPVLPFIDRVLYIAGGSARLGTPEQILCSECLSDLHGRPVEVINGRHGIAIVGACPAGAVA